MQQEQVYGNLQSCLNQKVGCQQVQKQEFRQKEFELEICRVRYQNKYQVIRVPKQQTSKQLIINNHLCYARGSTLTKISDISINDQIVRITDSFNIADILQDFEKSHQKPAQQVKFNADVFISQTKKHIIKKKPYIPGQHEEKNMTYKNTIKNVIRLFINWIKGISDPSKVNLIRKIQTLIQKNKFNNQLIVLIAQEPQLNKIFVEFIDKGSYQYIESSKIKQKQSHISSLRYYRKVMTDFQNLKTKM